MFKRNYKTRKTTVQQSTSDTLPKSDNLPTATNLSKPLLKESSNQSASASSSNQVSNSKIVSTSNNASKNSEIQTANRGSKRKSCFNDFDLSDVKNLSNYCSFRHCNDASILVNQENIADKSYNQLTKDSDLCNFDIVSRLFGETNKRKKLNLSIKDQEDMISAFRIGLLPAYNLNNSNDEFDDLPKDDETIGLSEVNNPYNCPHSYSGFETASGTKIQLTEIQLQKANDFFQNEDVSLFRGIASFLWNYNYSFITDH